MPVAKPNQLRQVFKTEIGNDIFCSHITTNILILINQ